MFVLYAFFAISKLGSVKKRTGDQDKNSLYWQNTPENPSECWIYSKTHACILFKQPTGKTLSAVYDLLTLPKAYTVKCT